MHIPLALTGLWWIGDVDPLTALVIVVLLTAQWPFCIQLTDGVEIYLPIAWTSAAAAYLLGPAILPIYWVGGVFGFIAIIELDRRGIVPAVGLAAESARRFRGEPFAPESIVDGDLRHFTVISELAVRGFVVMGTAAFRLPLLATVLIAELGVVGWQRIVPIPGRMAPGRTTARLAAALGPAMPLATQILHVVMVWLLLTAEAQGGLPGFVLASGATLVLHVVFKRLNDTRIESERRRTDLVAMQAELDRRHRLATIGETASTVFHQLGRQHGAINMYAHLLSRGPDPGKEPGAWVRTAREHAARITTSVTEANHVMDDLLRFAQDRTPNLFALDLNEVLTEAVDEVRPRADAHGLTLDIAVHPACVLPLDKHKLKQVFGNVLDNAIDASPPAGRLGITIHVAPRAVQIAVHDDGPGVDPRFRSRLFTPFATTKPTGIGLGLALAKELVAAHDGTIALHDDGPGATFVVTLPRELG